MVPVPGLLEGIDKGSGFRAQGDLKGLGFGFRVPLRSFFKGALEGLL